LVGLLWIGAMPAIIITTVAAIEKKPGSKDVETVFKIIIFAFD
jgi:hypothetical protein